MHGRPLVLVDVDGVLNPLAARPGFRRYQCAIRDETYTVRLNEAHGTWLMELALSARAELVWATTWEEAANEWIAPRIGLPPLPVIPMAPDLPCELGEMFKTPHVAEYVAGRPFVWFDDQVFEEDEKYLGARRGIGPFLLINVDPRLGLTREHIECAREWLTLSGFSQGR
ncbi:HAD domain-containing protein [Thermoactinospora rubra]|uniref:HAD domain-containing protein n=1 Tax=Thermoactinospora rubra TaxID=1088767 RepID=UPI000A0FCAC5|nr:HAD domain-containing protein [Thermoactinospora rubra]